MRWISLLVLVVASACALPASAQQLVGMRHVRIPGESYQREREPPETSLDAQIIGATGIGVGVAGAALAVGFGVGLGGDPSDPTFVIPIAVACAVGALGIVMAVFAYIDLFTHHTSTPAFAVGPGGLTLTF